MTWKKSKNGKQGVLVCTDCGKQSDTYNIRSPAAPELSLCEQAEADGWDYNIGFYAMLLGHKTLCPTCATNAQREVVQ